MNISIKLFGLLYMLSFNIGYAQKPDSSIVKSSQVQKPRYLRPKQNPLQNLCSLWLQPHIPPK